MEVAMRMSRNEIEHLEGGLKEAITYSLMLLFVGLFIFSHDVYGFVRDMKASHLTGRLSSPPVLRLLVFVASIFVEYLHQFDRN